MKALARTVGLDYTENQESTEMKNKQSLRLHQAQRQRQAFSPARSRFVETLTKNRQELAVELRSLIAANPFLHTVSDEVRSGPARVRSSRRLTEPAAHRPLALPPRRGGVYH